MPAGGRRLTLSPIGFDIILALSQAPGGLRLAEIAHVLGSPVSSVHTSLRVLVGNHLVRREGADPPRYVIATDHPAAEALVSTATVIGDPAHAIGLMLRANPAVSWAAVDGAGFLAGVLPEAEPRAREALDRQLQMISSARPGSPNVERMPMAELDRLARVALELRSRAHKAVTIKGRAPLAARSAAAQARAV